MEWLQHGKNNFIIKLIIFKNNLWGDDVAKDYKKTIKWYKLAAEQEYPEAQCNLGICYKYGYGIDKDEKEADKWLELAKSQGFDYAKSRLTGCNQNQE